MLAILPGVTRGISSRGNSFAEQQKISRVRVPVGIDPMAPIGIGGQRPTDYKSVPRKFVGLGRTFSTRTKAAVSHVTLNQLQHFNTSTLQHNV